MSDLERGSLHSNPFRLAENRSLSFNQLDLVEMTLEREALSPLSLSGLPKITSHFSTGSVFRPTLRGKPSHRWLPFPGLPKIALHLLNLARFCERTLRGKSSHCSPFRLAENRSPFFCRSDLRKDLGREAPPRLHPRFPACQNHSATFLPVRFVKDLEREAPLTSSFPFPACRKSFRIFQSIQFL